MRQILMIIGLLGSIMLCNAEELELRVSQSGEISIKTHYIKGTTIKHGVQRKYNKEGKKIFEANYVNGELHGKVLAFFDNGQTKEIVFYDMGKKEGLHQRFYINGVPLLEQYYANNKEHGIGKKHYPNGALKSEYEYENGIKQGIQKDYDKDGLLQYETIYKDGKKVSRKEFDKSGKMIDETNCRWKSCY